MKICCNFWSKLLLPLFALLLTMGSLQAQTKPACDLSKCSPEEREACAKKCTSNASATASLASFLFAESETAKPNCNPAACKKTSATVTAKLVSTQRVEAPIYSNSLSAKSEEIPLKKKKCCATAASCSKAKASL